MKKAKGSSGGGLPWGGRFVTEDSNPEVYAKLPEYWKKRMAIIRERVLARQPVTLELLDRWASAPEEVPEHLPAEITLRTLVCWVKAKGRIPDLLSELDSA